MTSRTFRTAGLALALGGSLWLAGCAPLVIGSAVGGAMIAADRRTSGAQVEDQSIELKAIGRVRDTVGERGHVNVTSYNRLVLLTGEVPSEADRAAVEQAVARIENVRATVNELAVIGNSSLTSRSNDLLIAGKVKAAMVDSADVPASAFKVVTERGNVYLMGRVTDREAERAAELARTVGGVQKVVKVVESITEAERAALLPQPPAGNTTPPGQR